MYRISCIMEGYILNIFTEFSPLFMFIKKGDKRMANIYPN